MSTQDKTREEVYPTFRRLTNEEIAGICGQLRNELEGWGLDEYGDKLSCEPDLGDGEFYVMLEGDCWQDWTPGGFYDDTCGRYCDMSEGELGISLDSGTVVPYDPLNFDEEGWALTREELDRIEEAFNPCTRRYKRNQRH